MAEQWNCANCFIRLKSDIKPLQLGMESAEVQSLLAMWIHPLPVNKTDMICQACHDLAVTVVGGFAEVKSKEEQSLPPRAPRRTCVICGGSVATASARPVINKRLSRPQRLNHARICATMIAPRKLKPSDVACATCWSIITKTGVPRTRFTDHDMISDHDGSSEDDNPEDPDLSEDVAKDDKKTNKKYEVNAANNVIDEIYNTSNAQLLKERNLDTLNGLEWEQSSDEDTDAGEEEKVVLPTFKRAPNTATRCIYVGCKGLDKKLVPDFVRMQVLNNYRYFLPKNARICSDHLKQKSFHTLPKNNSTCCFNSFTVEQIEEMISLSRYKPNSIDFEDLENMDSDLLEYWTGVSKVLFKKILRFTKLDEMQKGSVGLAALLCKLRTNDSIERLTKVVKMSESSLSRLILSAKAVLKKHPECVEMVCRRADFKSKRESIRKYFRLDYKTVRNDTKEGPNDVEERVRGAQESHDEQPLAKPSTSIDHPSLSMSPISNLKENGVLTRSGRKRRKITKDLEEDSHRTTPPAKLESGKVSDSQQRRKPHKRLSTPPKRLDTPPKILSTPPISRSPSPKSRNTPPKRLSVPSKCLSTPPKSRSASPKSLSTPPKRRSKEPKRLSLPHPPISRSNSQKNRNIPPKGRSIPSKRLSTPPKSLSASLKTLSTPPKRRRKPPNRLSIPSKRLSTPPKRPSTSLKRVSPPIQLSPTLKQPSTLLKRPTSPLKQMSTLLKRGSVPQKRLSNPPKRLDTPNSIKKPRISLNTSPKSLPVTPKNQNTPPEMVLRPQALSHDLKNHSDSSTSEMPVPSQTGNRSECWLETLDLVPKGGDSPKPEMTKDYSSDNETGLEALNDDESYVCIVVK